MQIKYNKNVNVKKALGYYIIKIVIILLLLLLLILIIHPSLFQIQFKIQLLSKPVQKGNLHNSSFLIQQWGCVLVNTVIFICNSVDKRIDLSPNLFSATLDVISFRRSELWADFISWRKWPILLFVNDSSAERGSEASSIVSWNHSAARIFGKKSLKSVNSCRLTVSHVLK